MKAAALYCRVSTDLQTVENQVRELTQLANARGLEPVVYEETASGVKRRPVLERLLADVRAGKTRYVLIVAIDRLGRQMAEIVNTVLEMDRCGAQVVSLRESWLDTTGPVRPLLLSILAWVSSTERDTLVARTKAGLRRARAQGKRLGRPPASIVLLRAAADLVGVGVSVAEAARRKGVHRNSLRRYLAQNVPSRAA